MLCQHSCALLARASLSWAVGPQGLYELFISKIDIADPDEDPEAHAKAHKGGFNISHRPQWLELDGLGDLKHRTGAVIIMIMGTCRIAAIHACISRADATPACAPQW